MLVNTRKLDDEFECLSTVGQGSYGIVYKVRCRKSDEIFALKRVKLKFNVNGHEDGIPSSSLREIAALKNLNHPNILRLHEIIHTGSSLFLLFEFLDQDLKKTLDSTAAGLSVKQAKNYMLQLFKAISYCHSRRILHRDLKLQNLLVNKDGTIKLADFGLARNMALPLRVYTKEVVTLWYRAPELLLGSDLYGPAVDIWSLGCIFYEILTKKVLFAGDSEIGQLFRIFQVLGTPTENEWSEITRLPHFKPTFPHWKRKAFSKLLPADAEATDLLNKCLNYDPLKRISAHEGVKHKFFDELTKRPSLRNIQDPSYLRNERDDF